MKRVLLRDIYWF